MFSHFPYKSPLSESFQERFLGLVVAFILLSFLFVKLFGLPFSFSSEKVYTLYGDVEYVDGLRVGDPIFVSGVVVGKVDHLSLSSGFFAHLRLQLQKDKSFPADSFLQVKTAGLLGGKFIEIIPGVSGQYMRDGDSFDLGQSPIFLPDSLEVLGKIIKNKGKKVSYFDQLSVLLDKYAARGKLPAEIYRKWKEYKGNS